MDLTKLLSLFMFLLYRQGIAIKEVELGYRHPEVGEAIFQLATATQRVPSMGKQTISLFFSLSHICVFVLF